MEHTSQQTLAKHATCFKIGSTNSDQRFSVENRFRIHCESIHLFGIKAFQLFGTTFGTSCHNSETYSEDKFLKFNHM